MTLVLGDLCNYGPRALPSLTTNSSIPNKVAGSPVGCVKKCQIFCSMENILQQPQITEKESEAEITYLLQKTSASPLGLVATRFFASFTRTCSVPLPRVAFGSCSSNFRPTIRSPRVPCCSSNCSVCKQNTT